MWTLWLLVGLLVWTAVALLVAVLIGRGIRIADARSSTLELRPPEAADAPVRRTAPRSDQRKVGLAGIGVILAAVAVALEAVSYAAHLSGVTGVAGRVLSMDGPVGLPRLYVTVLFAAAAVIAVLGAARRPERRAWWVAVAVVAAAVAGIKGGVLHGAAFVRLSDALSFGGALAVSLSVAALAVTGLWWLSRSERRDRARVLGALTLYAAASVGLSAVSSALLGLGGAGTLALAATFVEESMEGVAAVAFLTAVLVGVTPHLALPAGWALRRASDASAMAGQTSPAVAVPRPRGPVT